MTLHPSLGLQPLHPHTEHIMDRDTSFNAVTKNNWYSVSLYLNLGVFKRTGQIFSASCSRSLSLLDVFSLYCLVCGFDVAAFHVCKTHTPVAVTVYRTDGLQHLRGLEFQVISVPNDKDLNTVEAATEGGNLFIKSKNLYSAWPWLNKICLL